MEIIIWQIKMSVLLNDNSLAEIRNKEIGFVFQSFNLLPKSTALENVMLAANIFRL